jgi:hypothetical protein
MSNFIERDLEFFAGREKPDQAVLLLYAGERYEFYDGVVCPRTHAMWKFIWQIEPGVIQRFTACVDLAGAGAAADNQNALAAMFDLMIRSDDGHVRIDDVARLTPIYERARQGEIGRSLCEGGPSAHLICR